MWRGRHRNILLAILVQVPLLLALGLYEGTESVTGAEIPRDADVDARRHDRGRRRNCGAGELAATRAPDADRPRGVQRDDGVDGVGQVLWGYIEAHFHFFVFLAVLAVYEDWLPFAVGMGYVAVGHGTFSLIDSSLVYNHPAAIANPIVWGGIHAVFVTALAAALMVNWYSIEKSREEAQRQLDLVAAQKAEIQDVEAAKAEAEARSAEVERLNRRLETTADDYSATMDRAADGDLTVRLDADSESEAMEQIGAGFNEMMDEIEATMGIQSFAGEVSAASEKTVAGVDTAEARSEDVSRSVTEIAEGADDQREMLERVSGEMNTLSATIEEVASSTETVADAAKETASIADEGQDTAGEAIDSVGESRDAIGETAEKVKILDERMEDIGEIVDLIGDIAGQTNLLALNANIEAARAGGGGGGSGGSDGFAVVADEVKQLAEETQEAAQEIEELIAGTRRRRRRPSRESEPPKRTCRAEPKPSETLPTRSPRWRTTRERPTTGSARSARRPTIKPRAQRRRCRWSRRSRGSAGRPPTRPTRSARRPTNSSPRCRRRPPRPTRSPSRPSGCRRCSGSSRFAGSHPTTRRRQERATLP